MLMTDFRELVYRGVESDVLDYKAPVNWNTLSKVQKAKFVRHALAFANTRGGAIVIGVREDLNGHPSLYEGLNDEECHSFDPSTVVTYINSHVDPAIDITVERPLIDGKRYAILIIKPFKDIPHVAIHGIEEELHSGMFYIRSASASSRPAVRAGEMHELIRRALRNQKELLGSLLKDILGNQTASTAENTSSVNEPFPPEYAESVDFFAKRLNPTLAADTPVIDLAIMPVARGCHAPLADIRQAAAGAFAGMDQNAVADFLGTVDMQASYATNVSLRGMNKSRTGFWQFFQNGLLHFRWTLPRRIDRAVLTGQLSGILNFSRNYLQYPVFAFGNAVNLQLTICNSLNVELAAGDRSNFCRIDQIVISKNLPEGLSGNNLCSELIQELSVRFNLTAE